MQKAPLCPCCPKSPTHVLDPHRIVVLATREERNPCRSWPLSLCCPTFGAEHESAHRRVFFLVFFFFDSAQIYYFEIKHCGTAAMVGGALTKPLEKNLHRSFVDVLGLHGKSIIE